jgi:hypothetical protein
MSVEYKNDPSDGAPVSKLDVLMKYIGEEIDKSDRRRKKNKTWAVTLRLTSILSTAAIPVLLGMKLSSPQVALANVALIMGTLATIVNAWELFYGHKELWAANTVTWTELGSLKVDVEYAIASLPASTPAAISQEEIDRLHERFQKIMADSNAAWVGVRRAMLKQVPPQPAK